MKIAVALAAAVASSAAVANAEDCACLATCSVLGDPHVKSFDGEDVVNKEKDFDMYTKDGFSVVAHTFGSAYVGSVDVGTLKTFSKDDCTKKGEKFPTFNTTLDDGSTLSLDVTCWSGRTPNRKLTTSLRSSGQYSGFYLNVVLSKADYKYCDFKKNEQDATGACVKWDGFTPESLEKMCTATQAPSLPFRVPTAAPTPSTTGPTPSSTGPTSAPTSAPTPSTTVTSGPTPSSTGPTSAPTSAPTPSTTVTTAPTPSTTTGPTSAPIALPTSAPTQPPSTASPTSTPTEKLSATCKIFGDPHVTDFAGDTTMVEKGTQSVEVYSLEGFKVIGTVHHKFIRDLDISGEDSMDAATLCNTTAMGDDGKKTFTHTFKNGSLELEVSCRNTRHTGVPIVPWFFEIALTKTDYVTSESDDITTVETNEGATGVCVTGAPTTA